MSDHERLIAVTQRWDDEYKNLLHTARALLARAETAERHVESLSEENARLQVAANILEKLDAMYGFHVEGESICCYDGNNWASDDLTDVERAYLVAQDNKFEAARAAAVSVLKGPPTNE